ncbi:hypothetical protein ABZ442_05175 [Streptomyces triculaminicus]|uniref:hypothetical protein n=1 Tax=Streptomyces triculaminicus TaxID=2816232 RepID=UPI0033FD86BD
MKAGLGFTLAADGLAVVLRADEIRMETLKGLVREWPDAQNDVLDALDALAEVADPDADVHQAEVDARLEGVEAASCMDYRAQMELSFRDAIRLRDQLSRIITAHRLTFGRLADIVPSQHVDGAA